jgi:hypothetical protein
MAQVFNGAKLLKRTDMPSAIVSRKASPPTIPPHPLLAHKFPENDPITLDPR